MTTSASALREDTTRLDGSQSDRFARLGYLVLPGILPDDLVSRLKPEVDRWVDDGLRARSIASCTDPDTYGTPPVLELELAAHGELVGHPPLMNLLGRLLGPRFVFHHLHSDRQEPSRPGKPWHHDYEQNPQTDRAHSMIHTLHYLDGLDESTAALAVLPGSHRTVAEKTARAHLGTEEIPGELVIDRLPRGSTVVLHSALFHTRRPVTGADRPRYMIDASYCQAGVRWPPVKPYWRYMLRRGRELGLDHGTWPELFAERHFSEYSKEYSRPANRPAAQSA
ncbi:phytanoyl-CoA dioxygenase family protein [Streptomyces sp. MST-110588]|uniref:phytanoyl-CoA dioxygenase family protein n=1 Tax=Streptomyces sp. MST-110588 TaxID=2833628 RepID=UPI001F5E065E|nr:phytanoyl-CoA dioxygenase family protein [Streptomyces sp. MST-110588]UNO39198.1 phytanoyl-CoA dioxygenase family protein [Streptomyces sp. MST-110588]